MAGILSGSFFSASSLPPVLARHKILVSFSTEIIIFSYIFSLLPFPSSFAALYINWDSQTSGTAKMEEMLEKSFLLTMLVEKLPSALYERSCVEESKDISSGKKL